MHDNDDRASPHLSHGVVQPLRRRYDDSRFGPGLSWKHQIGCYRYPWRQEVSSIMHIFECEKFHLMRLECLASPVRHVGREAGLCIEESTVNEPSPWTVR